MGGINNREAIFEGMADGFVGLGAHDADAGLFGAFDEKGKIFCARPVSGFLVLLIG
jgi:hypothetical protein